MIVLSSNDYNGPYEQKYDPEHKHHPKGAGRGHENLYQILY